MQNYLRSLQTNAPKYKSLSNMKGPNLSFSSLGSLSLGKSPGLPQTGSPSSTAPTPTPSPTTTVKKDPARSAYEASINTGVPALGTKEYTDYLIEKGKALGINAPTTQGTPVASSGTPAASSSGTPAASSPKNDYLKSYRDYLSQYAESLKPSEDLALARTKLAEIQSRGEQTSTEARRRYESLLDESGPLKAGAEASARMDARRSNQELADIALQESAAARTLEALGGIESAKSASLKSMLELGKPLQIGDSYIDLFTGEVVYEKPEESKDFTLGEGQARYEYDPKTGTYKQVASVAKTFAPKTGTGADGTISPYQIERGVRTLQSVGELRKKAEENPGIFGRSAAAPIPNFLRSDAFRNFTSELDTLKASIAFNELTAMREASKTGGALGQVSNIELGLLESALGALRMDQSPENFQAQLTKIEDSINRWLAAGGAAYMGTGGQSGSSGVLRSPDGTMEVNVADLTPEELAEAQAAGWQ